MQTPEWRQITGFADYEVSDAGQVRRAGRLKTLGEDRKGYRYVSLWRDRKPFKRFVARLVAEAFIGPRPDGHVVRHRDGDKSNDVVANLVYGTPAENELDKRAHGTAPIGESHPAAKLTAEKVAEIRRRYVYGSRTDGCTAIARDYGVTSKTIHYVVTGEHWQ